MIALLNMKLKSRIYYFSLLTYDNLTITGINLIGTNQTAFPTGSRQAQVIHIPPRCHRVDQRSNHNNSTQLPLGYDSGCRSNGYMLDQNLFFQQPFSTLLLLLKHLNHPTVKNCFSSEERINRTLRMQFSQTNLQTHSKKYSRLLVFFMSPQ